MFCTWCHSFPFSPSGSADGDINQSMDTRAEAVMCQHAGVSRDGQRWMTHTDTGECFNGRTISRTQLEQASEVVGFKFFALLEKHWGGNSLIKVRGTARETFSPERQSDTRFPE